MSERNERWLELVLMTALIVLMLATLWLLQNIEGPQFTRTLTNVWSVCEQIAP